MATTITAANYEQHKPALATLSPEQRSVYDLLEEFAGIGDTAQDVYNDPDNTEGLKVYFDSLNRNTRPAQPSAKAASETKPTRQPGEQAYIAFFGSKKLELYAKGVYEAKLKAVAHFKVSKSKEHLVTAHFAHEDEPEQAPVKLKHKFAVGDRVKSTNERAARNLEGVVMALKTGRILTDGSGHEQPFYDVKWDGRGGLDFFPERDLVLAPKARRKATGTTPKGRKGKALPKRKPAGPELAQVKIDCRILESDDACVVEGTTPGGDRLRFIMQEHEEYPTNEDDAVLYSYTVYAVAEEGDDLDNAPLVGKGRVATMFAKKFGAQVIAFYEKALAAGLTTRKQEQEARLKSRERLSRRNSPRLTTPPVSAKPAPTPKKPTKTAGTGSKKPVKAKTAATPKAKKATPADTRTEVAHFDAELTFFRQFVALTEKPVTLVQVRNLHRKLEKAIASRKVRKASVNAPLLRLVSEKVAAAFEKMSKANIATVDMLTFPPKVVIMARALATGSKVSSAVRLLSEFINLQGQQPDAKRVAGLLKSLEKEHADHAKSAYATAVGAAAATLRDWQPGRKVGISASQLGALGGLSGLGCACQEAAAAKAVPLASTPTTKRTTARPALGSADAQFTVIGEKDHRAAVGKLLHLPGDLGNFLGDIEDHEYALAIRGEKGAGKSRLLYQLKNLFAGAGKRVASFSLEIGKNSSVVSRYTQDYISPANRARVMIASEAPQGLDSIRQAARDFDVVAIDSWGKIPGVVASDFDVIRKEFPNTFFLVIFQSTTAGTSRGGSSSEYDASAVCQVNLPGVAVMEKNRYATGAADELRYLINEQRLAKSGE